MNQDIRYPHEKESNNALRRYVIKNFIAVILVVAAFFSTSAVVKAEGRTAEEYMAEGIRAVYDNMHLIYQGFYDENGELEAQPGGFVAIWQEWEEYQLLSRTFLGPHGEPIDRVDGYSKYVWEKDENGKQDITFYDVNDNVISLEGVILTGSVATVENSWSDWMSPPTNTDNCVFELGYVLLGEKEVGDSYLCQLEIEFYNVKTNTPNLFRFQTQGTVDNDWKAANIWYPNVIYLSEPPNDGVYTFSSIVTLNEEQVNSNAFEIEFRCDYWSSGEFRVRNIIIAKE